MSQREEDRQYYNETIIDPMSSDFAQDGLLSQVINSEELKEILTNFKSLKPEELNHLFESQNDLSSMMGSGDAFLPNGTINQMILTPANESLPVLNNLAQDLKPLKRCCGNVDDGDRSSLPPAFKRGRIQECDSSTYICAESLKTPSPVPSIYDTNAYEVPDQCNREGQMLPFQTVYTHHICESDEAKGLPIRATMRDRYHNRMHFAGKSKRLPVAVANYNSEHYDRYKSNYDVVETGTPRIHAFLVPQEKGRSKNFDYIGGTATEDPNCDYFVYCRGRPTVVPFAVGIENIQAEEAKLKVQVVFGKIKNRVPIRCSNHKEGDNTVWRDQLMISTDPTAQSLSYQEGHGFVIHPVPPRCDVLFLCRNSCRQGVEKDWQLQFTLMDQDDTELAVRTMGLRVCEVPHRDIMKSKVQFEWNASLSPPERPVMKVLACKEGMQVEQLFPRVATDVYPIYVSGYQSYCEIMQYVSSMELRKKHENPAIAHVAEFMRNWNRATPIMRFLQPVCGVEASLLLDKLNRKDVRTLGDLYSKYTPDFFVNMHISSALASQLSALYLNWRNIIEYYEMSVSKEVFKF